MPRRFIPSLAAHRAERRERERLIQQTIDAWIEVDPKHARAASHFLHEISKVDHANMRTAAARRAGLRLKIRFPQDLFLLLRSTFEKFLPTQEPFAHDDSDWDLVYKLYPRFMPKRKA